MTDTDRINRILDHLDIKPAEFARILKLKYAQNIYDIQKGKTGISKDVASRIIDNYPDVDLNWLLTGTGSMLKNESSEEDGAVLSGKMIPFFDAEAVAGGHDYAVSTEAVTQPIGMIEIGSLLKDSESALRIYGNSMTPNYPAGCVVGLRRHTDSFIEPGYVYVVETLENRYIKRLYPTKDKSAIRCVSDNHMLHEAGPMTGELYYPEFDIPFEDVRRVFRVVGVIKRNVL